MSSSVSLHGTSLGSSEPAVCLTCSPGKNWHYEPDFGAGRAAPVQDSLPAAFLFPKLQQKWTSNNMACQDLRQAKTNIDDFPASAMHSVGCFSIAFHEPGLREHGLSCLHAAGDSLVSRISFTLSLKPFLTPSAPQSCVDWVYIQQWQTGGSGDEDRVLTLSPLGMSGRRQASLLTF